MAAGMLSVFDQVPSSRDGCVLSGVMEVVAAVDRCGGRDGMEVPSSSDRGLVLIPMVQALISREGVRALVTRCVRMASQVQTGLCPHRTCRTVAQELMHETRRMNQLLNRERNCGKKRSSQPGNRLTGPCPVIQHMTARRAEGRWKERKRRMVRTDS